MPLLINDKDRITITVKYVDGPAGLKFFEDANGVDGVLTEKFVFRRPNWKIMSKIMVESMVLTTNGVLTVNPYIFMDLKVKNLITDWTMKDSDGNSVPLSPEVVGNLHPDLWEYLSRKLDAYISSSIPDGNLAPTDEGKKTANEKDDNKDGSQN